MNPSFWMTRALALAQKALGQTFPNPIVGAIVLDAYGRCVGQGFHQKAGHAHAEVLALKQAGSKAQGGTLFVTLEPCHHFGQTPPCTQSIVQSKVKTIVVATKDPNPKVNGQGIAFLKSIGLNIVVGIEEEKAKRLNAVFFHNITKQKPFVRAKLAVTKNWIMGERHQRLLISNPLRENTSMKLRAQSQLILVGAKTINIDRPRLTIRGRFCHLTPSLAVISKTLSVNLNTPAFLDSRKKIIFYDASYAKPIQNLDHLDYIPIDFSKPVFTQIKNVLSNLGYESLLVEGGKQTLSQALNESALDHFVLIQSHEHLALSTNHVVFNQESLCTLKKIKTISTRLDTQIIYKKQ